MTSTVMAVLCFRRAILPRMNTDWYRQILPKSDQNVQKSVPPGSQIMPWNPLPPPASARAQSSMCMTA